MSTDETGPVIDLRGELLRSATAGSPWDAAGAELPAGLLLDLLTRAAEHGIHPRGIQVQNARITGGMQWDWQELAVPLRLTACVIDGPVVLDHARVAGLSLSRCELPGLNALHLNCASGVGITDSTITGMVVLRAATLAGSLLLSGSTVHGEPSSLDGSPERMAVQAQQLRLRGACVLDQGFTAHGAVVFDSSEMGNLLCLGGHFLNPGGTALRVRGADLSGSAVLTKGFEAEGLMAFNRTTIRGSLALDGAKLTAPGTEAFSASGTEIGGGLYLVDGFSASGQVSLTGARIGGSVICQDASFTQAGGVALSLADAQIEGNVRLSSGFSATGQVWLPGTRIGGFLDCDGGAFDESFEAQNASVTGSLRWRRLSSVPRKVSLRRAAVGDLDDDLESWPPSNIWVTGFSYERFSDRAPRTVKGRIDWLRRQDVYAPEPYQQLAQVYRVNGELSEATAVAIAQQDDQIRRGDLRGPARAWAWFLGWSIGHGYRPGRAAWALLVLYVITLGSVWAGANSEAFVQVGNTAPQATVSAAHCGPAYPCLSAAAYALENITPILNLHQAENWQPKSSTLAEELLRDWLYLSTVTGYAGTTLLAAALSGLARRA